MKLEYIETEIEHKAALACVERLMDAAPSSPQEVELDRLSLLVEKYEDAHFPIETPSVN